MKINKSLEQAVYVIIILALQKDKQPVKSHIISEILKVSDSYLKKILMKLSKAKLVNSNASKNGGYQLNKSVEEITLKDVFFALQLNEEVIEFKHLSHRVFEDEKHVKKGEEKILNVLKNGLNSFYKEMETLKISDLLYKEAYLNGAINWESKIIKK